MTANLKSAKAVWQAFEKFIHTQVQVKGRSVDTQTVGLFRLNDQRVEFLPNPDYLEVGKFKPQKGIVPRTHGEDGPHTYRDFYDKVKTDTADMLQMSFVAFSVVTNVSTEQVRRILVDIFQAVVEASRRT